MQALSWCYGIDINGDKYIYHAIRHELKNTDHGQAWRRHSITETLLDSFDAWGIEAAILKSKKMFSFAVWDKNNRTLLLGRDCSCTTTP